MQRKPRNSGNYRTCECNQTYLNQDSLCRNFKRAHALRDRDETHIPQCEKKDAHALYEKGHMENAERSTRSNTQHARRHAVYEEEMHPHSSYTMHPHSSLITCISLSSSSSLAGVLVQILLVKTYALLEAKAPANASFLLLCPLFNFKSEVCLSHLSANYRLGQDVMNMFTCMKVCGEERADDGLSLALWMQVCGEERADDARGERKGTAQKGAPRGFRAAGKRTSSQGSAQKGAPRQVASTRPACRSMTPSSEESTCLQRAGA
jgi:hypothetical protein